MLAMTSLLYFEDRYSKQPYSLLIIYLTVTLLFDVANIRSLFARDGLHALVTVAAAIVLVKLVLLALEEVPKLATLKDGAFKKATGDLWSRAVFWWLNSMFLRGFRDVLQIGDLSAIDDAFASDVLFAKLDQAWTTGTSAMPHPHTTRVPRY